MKSLTEIEREARRTRELIAELKSYTPKFNAAKERAEEELLVHLDKINVEREHLEDLKDAAALIVEHLGTDVPVEMLRTQEEVAAVMAADQAHEIEAHEVEQVEAHDVEAAEIEADEIRSLRSRIEAAADQAERIAEPCVELVAMIDSPQEIDAPQTMDSPQTVASDDHAEILDPEPTFETIGAIAAEITAHVAAMAGDQPSTPDATDEPELTDEQVERKELELASAGARPAKFFNAFAANPFA
jgi:hypothetical protein